jgi:hypothetical protein
MNKKILLLLVLFSIISFFACKKTTLDPVDVGYTYYPVNIGHWIIYEVDSTVWDGFYTDTSALFERHYHYYIKEIVESEYYDNEGRLTQRLERYEKLCDTCNWFIKDVWAVNLTASTAERVEENNRFVKLVFPVESSASWDGNAFNILGEQYYEYDDLYNLYSIGGSNFDSTITVIEKIDTNAIEASRQYEIYTHNIGMIFRRYRDVKITNFPSYEIESGTDYTYKFISYGN